MELNDLIAKIAKKLLPICKDTTEAWWLLEAVTRLSQSQLMAQKRIKLSWEQEKILDALIKQRVEENKPLQYILGTVPFCGLEIMVKPPVLIPRPETEELCAWLIKELEPVKEEPLKILDLGVGSGCIALALAKALPYATVIGVDIHLHAIRLSEKNKAHNNITNAIFLQSDLYQELTQHKSTFDLIVSNPPYIAPKEYETLSEQVTKWEDKSALVAAEEGFAIHKKIIADAKKFLAPPRGFPQLVLEFGKGQEDVLKKLFEESGFKGKVYKDMEKVDRWITGTQ